MFRNRLNQKAQVTAEYAILIGIVIAAILGVQTYTKMNLQGKVRDVLNYAPSNFNLGGTPFAFSGNLYDPQKDVRLATSVASQVSTTDKQTVQGQTVVNGISGRTSNVEGTESTQVND